MINKKSVVKKKKKSALVPVSLAVLVAVLFYKVTDIKVQAEVAPITVPYAKVRINEHTEIKKDMVGFITVSAKSLPPNTVVVNPDELLGKFVGTNYTIPEKGYFYKDMLSTLDQIPTRIPKLLDKGQVGITMRVDLERSVANSLKDDMWVQVRFFTDRTPSNMPVEGVLEEKIKILAVRDNSGRDVVKTEHEQSKVPTVVVFDASDEQASYLFRAKNLGELNLVALSESDAPISEKAQLEKQAPQSNPNESGSAPVPAAAIEQIPSANPEGAATNNLNQTSDSDTILQLINGLGNKLAPEQKLMLESLATEKKVEDGKGKKFTGNPIKLFIDSMTYNIETQFEDKYFVTPKGEVVYFDKEQNQLRYFETQEKFKDSTYVLQELSPDEINQVLNTKPNPSSGGASVATPTTPSTTQGNTSGSANTAPNSTNQTQNKTEPAKNPITKDPMTFSGKGKSVSNKFFLSKGIGVLNIQFQGSGPMIVNLLDSEGRAKKLLDHKEGMYQGKKAFSVSAAGEYILDVDANGSWSISVEQ
ncbi:RcpC/CpaB family pilus assembly protein [Brevibacillus sp. NPDC003359]|uniref:RcpC/CpaB family pilus assembly protein n=1 Tax=unclassified Brevibacillus TaxID=2684853 RepID=UPI0036D14FA2